VEFKPEFYCNLCGEEKWFSDPAHERLVQEYTELTCSCGVEVVENRELLSRHKRRCCNSELFHTLWVSLMMGVKRAAASSSATPRDSIVEAVGV
jgi:hypothetical protein